MTLDNSSERNWSKLEKTLLDTFTSCTSYIKCLSRLN
jgi:hypothetical protein